MAPRTFVRDSDDSGDETDSSLLSNSPDNSRVSGSRALSNEIGQAQAVDASASGSLSSNERLNRDIRAAHESLLLAHHDFLRENNGTPGHSTSITTLDEGGLQRSGGEVDADTDRGQYRSRRGLSEGFSTRDYAASAEGAAAARNRELHELQGPGNNAGAQETEAWGFPPSLQHDFALHEPEVMFPEPSSTAPDGTWTQQRLMEDSVMAFHAPVVPEVLLGEVVDASTNRSNSPVPWQDYVTLSSNTSTSKLNVSQPAHSSTSHPGKSSEAIAEQNSELNHDNLSKVNLNPIEQTGETENVPLGNGDAISSTGQAPANGVEHSLNDIPIHEENPAQPKGKLKRIDRKRKATPLEDADGDILAFTPKAKRTKSKGSMGEADQSKDRSSNGSSGRTTDAHDAHLSSDELIVGVPKEQYKPRPSRSRSSRFIEAESINYSIPVEKAVKSKRRKTATGSSGIDAAPSQHNIDSICGMGFTPRRAKKALELNNDVMEGAIEWLCNNPLFSPRSKRNASKNNTRDDQDNQPGEDPQARSQMHSEPHGNEVTKPQDQNSNNEHPDEELQEPVELISHEKPAGDTAINPDNAVGHEPRQPTETITSPSITSKVQIVIPAKEPQSHPHIPRKKPRLKANRSKTVPVEISASEDEDEDEAETKAPSPPPLKAKRGRGRPRLNKQAIEAPDASSSTVDPNTNVNADATMDEPKATTSNTAEPKAAAPKKGRGRPRKSDKTPATVQEAPESGPVEEEPDRLSNTAVETPLEELDPNAAVTSKAGTTEKETLAREESDQEHEGEHSRSKSPAIDISAPDKENTAAPSSTPPKKNVQSASSGHSPLNKGKVPYRVGLSRRARIAPLLRIVKK